MKKKWIYGHDIGKIPAHKMMKVMKWCVVFMLGMSLHLSATTNAQIVKVKNSTLTFRALFEEVERQTGKITLFSNDELDMNQKIKLTAGEYAVEELYRKSLAGSQLNAFVEKEYIVIRRNSEKARSATGLAFDQKRLLRGIVKDETGTPLPGVSVIIKGTQTGIATDVNGEFEIEIDDNPNVILQFSFVGMEMLEVKPGKQSFLNIMLKSDSKTLDEVVCTGFQTISRERATGAFQIVNAEELQRIPAQDLGAKLEGLSTGMQVEYNEQTGATDITIRGLATMNADAKPLIVVDGFPVEGDFSSINPNDIENVTILKDAAAASIWGARAGNGVIVVTTKSGQKSIKPQVSFDAFVRVSPKMDLDYNLPIASSATQMELERFEIENGFGTLGTPDSFDQVFVAYTLGAQLAYDHRRALISDEDFDATFKRLKNINNSSQIKKYMLNNPFSQNYNLGINGGGEAHYYNFSAMYTSDENNLQGNKREKLLLNLKNTFELAKWLNFDFAVMTEIKKDKTGLTFEDVTQLSPYELLKNEDGTYAPVIKNYNKRLMDDFLATTEGMPYVNMNYNPLEDLEANHFTSKQLNLRLQAGLNIKFMEGLNYRGSFQYERFKTDDAKHYGEKSYYVRNLANQNVLVEDNRVITAYMPKGDILASTESLSQSYNLRHQLSFNRTFAEKHSVSVILGSELIWTETTGSGNVLYGYDSEKNTHTTPPYGYGSSDVVWPNLFVSWRNGSLPDGHNLTYSADRYVSFYGNATYVFNDKYSLTGSVRNDASNIIVDDPKYRYSPFWSVGLGWTISRESFLEKTDWIDRLAIRATFGKNGNTVTTASSVPIISWSASPSPITGELYGKISDKGNPSLRWEKIEQVNFGIDFSFFRRLSGSIDYYNKASKDLLTQVAISPTLGGTSQNMNAATVKNNGIEIDLSYSQRIAGDLKWLTGIKYSYNKSKVTDFAQQLVTTAATLWYDFVEGYAVNPLFSYIYEGMNENGLPVLRAAGTGNTFTMADYVGGSPFSDILQYEGTRTPTSVLSWTNTFTWKGITLRALVTGKLGHKFRRPTFSYIDYFNTKNYHKDLETILSGNAASLGLPDIPSEYFSDYFNYQDYVPKLNTLIENASHIRLREIYLGYDLPKPVCNKLHVSSIRLYSQIRNLGLIWAANKQGIDPDYIEGQVIKPEPSFTFGLNVNF